MNKKIKQMRKGQRSASGENVMDLNTDPSITKQTHTNKSRIC